MRKENTIKNIIVVLNIIIYVFFVSRNQYLFNITYLKCILFMFLNSLLIYVFGILKNDQKNYKLNIMVYIAFYIILLFTITMIIGRDKLNFYNWFYYGQYKPFHTIINQFKYGSRSLFIKNIIGNSIMLIPMSFLLMIKNKRYNNVFFQTIIVLPLIILIELLQSITHVGVFDIDDVLLNYFGILVFTFFITRFNLIDKIRNLFYTDFNLSRKVKKRIFYLTILITILYDILIYY